MKSKFLTWCVVAILFISIFTAGAARSWGQAGTTGSLAGTVGNSTGAPIAGAAVRLTNGATGQTQVTTTGTNGRYEFPTLPPGNYDVRFSVEGFKTAQMPAIVVDVSEDSVVDAKLDAGSTDTPVTCLCTLSHTAASSTGTLVDSKTITSVPLTTRNFTQVLSNASGAASAVTNAGQLGAGSTNVNVNGNTTANTYTIDGAVAHAVPNPDTITQFRIQTSQYDTGYGAHVPTTNLITKPGTNDFHGALWEFVRNDAFNANSFFQNANGQPKPVLKQNQFGATVGGPIKKNKLFFFGSYQGTRQINGLDATSSSTVFQPALTDNRSAAAIGAQFCAQNHLSDHGAAANPGNPFFTFAGGSFGVGSQVACDGSNINPVALNILQRKLPDGTYLVPTPQQIVPTTAKFVDDKTDPLHPVSYVYQYNLGYSSYSRPGTWNENQYLANIDYVISKNHTVVGRFFQSNVNNARGLGNPNAGAGSPAAPVVPGGLNKMGGKDYVASAKLTSVLTSNLVNEVRMTFTRDINQAFGASFPTPPSAIGMTPADRFFDVTPETTIQGSLGVFRLFGNSQDDFNSTDTYQWSDNLSWVHGKHTIRTGVFVDSATEDRLNPGPGSSRGRMTIQNFTDFLLGQSAAANGSPTGLSNIDSVSANEGAGPNGQFEDRNQAYSTAVFFQDDFKLRPRLTLNFGLRWEHIGPSFDPDGEKGNIWPSLSSLVPIPPASGTYAGVTIPANYDPATINPYTGLAFGPPPTGVFVRSTRGLYNNNGPLDAFAPRLAFAWQPGAKQKRLALRGGYGWFYQATPSGGNIGGTPPFAAQPFAQSLGNTGTSNGFSTLQKPFPTVTLGFQLRTPTSQLSDRVAGEEFKLPMLQQWNFAMQLTLARTLTLDVGYAGSYGTHLLIGRGLNQPLLATPGHPVNCGLPNTPAGLGVSAGQFATLGVDAAGCVTTNTTKNAYLRVPIIGESPTALVANQYSGISRYNGLQSTLRKQVSQGLAFQVSYTYSKSTNNTNWLNDQNNGRLNWARAGFDRTQRLVFSYTYDFPELAQGKRFLGVLLGGWSMSGVTSIQTGTPLTLTDRRGGFVYGRAAGSTISLCPGATYADLVTPGRNQDRLGNWINKSVIAGTDGGCPLPGVGSDGSTGYGTAGQSIMTGPGQNDWDLSVGKATRVGGIHEDSELQLRVEFYNAFNHPQFSNPGTVFGTSNFGTIAQTSVAPRLIQFGIKYLF